MIFKYSYKVNNKKNTARKNKAIRGTEWHLFARDQNYSNYLHFVDNKYPVCYKIFLPPEIDLTTFVQL